jgi:hypothetical protein
MSPSILRLPPLLVDMSDLGALAELVARLSVAWMVLIGASRSAAGDELDPFVLAAALASALHGRPLGVATDVGAGRTASMVAREATTTQLLGGCDALVLEGEPGACRDAALVVEALFEPGTHTVATPTAQIVDAVNDPVPNVEGGPPVRWRDGGRLRRLGVDGAAVDVGDVLDIELSEVHQVSRPASLVVVQHPHVTVRELSAALSR